MCVCVRVCACMDMYVYTSVFARTKAVDICAQVCNDEDCIIRVYNDEDCITRVCNDEDCITRFCNDEDCITCMQWRRLQ